MGKTASLMHYSGIAEVSISDSYEVRQVRSATYLISLADYLNRFYVLLYLS